MSGFLHFLAHRRGGVALIFAIAAMTILTLLGVGIDFGRAIDSKAKMQAALDAAVLAAVHKEPKSRGPIAERFFYDNAPPNMAAVESLAFATNNDGSYTGKAMARMPTAFSALMQIPYLNIAVNSTAIVLTTPAPCLLALDPSAGNSIWVHPHAEIRTEECGVGSNSWHRSAVNIEGKLRTKFLTVVGGVSSSRGEIEAEEGIATDAAPMADPYESLAVPSFSGCGGGKNLTVDKDTTLSPGVYCGGLKLRDEARVVLKKRYLHPRWRRSGYEGNYRNRRRKNQHRSDFQLLAQRYRFVQYPGP